MIDLYKQAAKIINNSDALLIGAGAGIGVDSGLPDFRGNEGFWKAYPPIAKLGIKFEEMANPYWFDKKPQLAWAFYGHRFNLYKNTIPHKGFEFLLEISKKMKHGYFIYTSNVDGQFQKAGFDNNKINEIHGSINHLQCTTPCTTKIWDTDFENLNIDNNEFKAVGELPTCPQCGKLARPNILMFGDWNWVSNRSAEQAATYHQWLRDLETTNSNLVIIELGAGKAVPSVRINSERIANNFNAKIIRINPRDYDVPAGHIGISAGSLEGLSQIMQYL